MVSLKQVDQSLQPNYSRLDSGSGELGTQQAAGSGMTLGPQGSKSRTKKDVNFMIGSQQSDYKLIKQSTKASTGDKGSPRVEF